MTANQNRFKWLQILMVNTQPSSDKSKIACQVWYWYRENRSACLQGSGGLRGRGGGHVCDAVSLTHGRRMDGEYRPPDPKLQGSPSSFGVDSIPSTPPSRTMKRRTSVWKSFFLFLSHSCNHQQTMLSYRKRRRGNRRAPAAPFSIESACFFSCFLV